MGEGLISHTAPAGVRAVAAVQGSSWVVQTVETVRSRMTNLSGFPGGGGPRKMSEVCLRREEKGRQPSSGVGR